MNTPLVSICSPCYNVAPFIGQFLNSLIEQTYKNLEIILVNDGSTDDTEQVIQEYLPRLQQEGFRVKIVSQPNGGLASAVQTALKHATGKYITWPDPDDWLTPESIECRVRFLEENPDVSLVRGHMEMWDDNKNVSLGILNNKPSQSGPYIDLFVDSLKSSISMAALANMVRASSLDEAVPRRELYVAKAAGQNWQIILPISYRFQCWHVQSVLGYYRIRPNSHSQQNRTYEQLIDLMYVIQYTITETLKNIPDVQSKYLQWTIKKYSYERLCYAKKQKKARDIWKFSRELLSVTPRVAEKCSIILKAFYHCIIKPIISR